MLKDKFINKVNILLVSFFLVIQKVLAAGNQLIPADMEEAFDPSKDPTEDLSLVYQLITALITFIFGLIGTVAVLMVIYGGFKYVTGSLSGKEEGKQTIKNALLGIVIALISYFIVNIFLEGLTTITTPAT